MNMNITTQPLTDAILVIVESDHLDAGNANEFKSLMQSHLEANSRVILDMNQLQFVDSSGLGTLLSCLRVMNNKQGQLHLVGMTKPVRALFELVRMHRIFPIFNTSEEALQAA